MIVPATFPPNTRRCCILVHDDYTPGAGLIYLLLLLLPPPAYASSSVKHCSSFSSEVGRRRPNCFPSESRAHCPLFFTSPPPIPRAKPQFCKPCPEVLGCNRDDINPEVRLFVEISSGVTSLSSKQLLPLQSAHLQNPQQPAWVTREDARLTALLCPPQICLRWLSELNNFTDVRIQNLWKPPIPRCSSSG